VNSRKILIDADAIYYNYYVFDENVPAKGGAKNKTPAASGRGKSSCQ
jgi:hypothetical protein